MSSEELTEHRAMVDLFGGLMIDKEDFRAAMALRLL